jgi:hypothetical protein
LLSFLLKKQRIPIIVYKFSFTITDAFTNKEN